VRDEEQFLLDLVGEGKDDGKEMRIEKDEVVDLDQVAGMNLCVNSNWK